MLEEVKKLISIFKQHGAIIIGVDFDDTIFPLNDKYINRCKAIRATLEEAKVCSKICLYTVADEQSLKYKIELMKLWGIPPDYVNESPIKLGDGSKPFFNILLDDKAGLNEAHNILKQFINAL